MIARRRMKDDVVEGYVRQPRPLSSLGWGGRVVVVTHAPSGQQYSTRVQSLAGTSTQSLKSSLQTP